MAEKKTDNAPNRRWSDPVIAKIDRTLHDPDNGVVVKLEQIDKTLRGSLKDGGKTGMLGDINGLKKDRKIHWTMIIGLYAIIIGLAVKVIVFGG